jgi:GDPmannose 4,6-dehydratase
LKQKNYTIYCLVRPKTLQDESKMQDFWDCVGGKSDQIRLLSGDITDKDSIYQAIQASRPHEIYHFAGIHHRSLANEMPEYVASASGLSTVRMLESIREIDPSIKFVQLCSSDIFEPGRGLTEKSPLRAQGSYGAAALYAYSMTEWYRKRHLMFACNAICFEHESPLRGPNFIGRSVSRGLARVLLSKQELLRVSDLDDVYDWGYAKEYVEAIYKMTTQFVSDDYVLATGSGHSLREFVSIACQFYGIDLAWKKVGTKEYGYDIHTHHTYIEASDQDGGRVSTGNSKKAQRVLDWTPKTRFTDLVTIMCEADFEREKKLKE